MPLAHAILGFLEYQPMSGYDLKKSFDQSIAHFWTATQSHIYKALDELEKGGMVQSHILPQEGRPNRKLYQITSQGRAELHRWAAAPLPFEVSRHAWLIQVFFAHGNSNAEITRLVEARIAALRQALANCRAAQAEIDQKHGQIGVERMRSLWQITLDYGANHYENEIAWLEELLPRLGALPAMEDQESS